MSNEWLAERKTPGSLIKITKCLSFFVCFFSERHLVSSNWRFRPRFTEERGKFLPIVDKGKCQGWVRVSECCNIRVMNVILKRMKEKFGILAYCYRKAHGLTSPSGKRIPITSPYAFTTNALWRDFGINPVIFNNNSGPR